MFKFLGKIFSGFKTILDILTFKPDWGNKVIREHPKLNRFYEKGFWARLFLFLVSLVIVGAIVAVQFYMWGAIFSGAWLLLIVLIPILWIITTPLKFLGNLCGISFYHFGTGLERGFKKLGSKISKKEDNEQKAENTITDQKVVEQNENQVQNNVENKKPKTRSIPSLIFFILEGLLTFGTGLSIAVIPFTVGVWMVN